MDSILRSTRICLQPTVVYSVLRVPGTVPEYTYSVQYAGTPVYCTPVPMLFVYYVSFKSHTHHNLHILSLTVSIICGYYFSDYVMHQVTEVTGWPPEEKSEGDFGCISHYSINNENDTAGTTSKRTSTDNISS